MRRLLYLPLPSEGPGPAHLVPFSDTAISQMAPKPVLNLFHKSVPSSAWIEFGSFRTDITWERG